MKFAKIMRLWMMGIIILFSIQCYASEEKITFTPTRESVHVFDITVSGKTDSQKVVVVHSAYLEETTVQYCPPTAVCEDYARPCNDWTRSIKLYVAIRKCGNPGTAEYSQSFKWYSYYGIGATVRLYVKENPELGEYEDYGSYKLVATEYPSYLIGPATDISIGKSAFEIKGADWFAAHNISLPGYEGLYWATFRWNPYTLSWTFEEAGAEK